MKKNGFTTETLHSDRGDKPEHGVLHKPIHTSVAFEYDDARDLAKVFQGKMAGYNYGRQQNPTVNALQEKISKMEQGIASVVFGTGMAAIGSTLLALLRSGDHIVSSAFLFGNTNSLLNTLQNFGVEVTFVDATESKNVEQAIQPNTKLVFVETIANPVTQVADLKNIGAICEQNNLLYFVDNTLTTPHLFSPKSVKASLIINSLTKAIGGHGNALGGCVTDTGLYDWTKFSNIYDSYKNAKPALWGITQVRKKGLRDFGAAIAPEAAHHIAVGAETLSMRIDKACHNAFTLAQLCQQHKAVENVYYPGLEDHPQHESAKHFFKAFGGLFSIDLVDGVDCFDFLNKLELVASSSNLGDNRSLGIPVAHTIYYEMGPERRASMGIADSMLRFSIGIEDTEDLVQDFTRALDLVCAQ